MRHDNFIPQPRLVEIRSRGRLVHWQVDDAMYFITFGLRDALPPRARESLFREREQMMRGIRTTAERARIDRALALKLDQYLDCGGGMCILRKHGALVASALQHFDGSRYALHAWCVMPNHVHVLVHIPRGEELPKIVHSWKSFTAHRIGHGEIWQREYFDRVIRSPQEFSDTRAYIRNNPAKAGLREWPWVG
jgi:REP element-mobilizing transposase RayT